MLVWHSDAVSQALERHWLLEMSGSTTTKLFLLYLRTQIGGGLFHCIAPNSKTDILIEPREIINELFSSMGL